MRRRAVALFFAGVACAAGGAIQWLGSWPADQHARAALRATLALVAAAVLAGGAVRAYSTSRIRSSRRICMPALIAPSLAEREAARVEGLGPLYPVFDADDSCLELQQDRIDYERAGTCSAFVMDDVPCSCGKERWIGRQSQYRCLDAPTSCELRGDRALKSDGAGQALGLGCPTADNTTLEDARRYAK